MLLPIDDKGDSLSGQEGSILWGNKKPRRRLAIFVAPNVMRLGVRKNRSGV
jgi:hypothetical protein